MRIAGVRRRMTAMKRVLLLGVALGLLVPLAGRAANGEKPLDFKFTAADGSSVDLADMRGKVVIIFYWATWSKPSRDEVKTVVNVRKKYRDKGLEVMGVSLDTDQNTMQTYTDEYSMNWPEFFSEQGPNNLAIVGMHLKGIPTVWVVGKDGCVIAKDPPGNLDAVVEKALAAK